MIHVQFRRFEAHDGYEYPAIEREMLPSHAAVMLLRHELGWGGRVIELEDTSLTVRTPCMAKVDKDTYSGSIEEMQTLHRAVRIWGELKGISNVMTEVAADRIKQLVPSESIASSMSAVFGNTSVVNMALTRLVGLEEHHRKQALKMDYKTLDPIIELMLETNASFDDCLEVAA